MFQSPETPQKAWGYTTVLPLLDDIIRCHGYRRVDSNGEDQHYWLVVATDRIVHSTPDCLVEAIRCFIASYFINYEYGIPKTMKRGQLAYTIQLGGGKYINMEVTVLDTLLTLH